jgi:hypothetical protein
MRLICASVSETFRQRWFFCLLENLRESFLSFGFGGHGFQKGRGEAEVRLKRHARHRQRETEKREERERGPEREPQRDRDRRERRKRERARERGPERLTWSLPMSGCIRTFVNKRQKDSFSSRVWQLEAKACWR